MAVVARSLLASVDLDQVLDGIARGLCEVTGRQRSVILAYDDEADRLTGLAAHGLDADEVRGIDLPVTPLVRRAIVAGCTRVSDRAGDVPPTVADIRDRYGTHGTIAVLPLRSDELGTMGVAFLEDAGRTFRLHAQEREKLETFVGLGAMAMQNAILAERSRRLASMLARTRAAEELHDSITQSLFALRLGLDNVIEEADLSDAVRTRLQGLRSEAQSAVEGVHRALHSMTDGITQGEGPGKSSVLDGVDDIVARVLIEHELVGDVHVDGEDNEPDEATGALIVRTVQEGLANVAKHAQATRFSVQIRRSSTWWTVEVSDDGIGDPVAIRTGWSRGDEGFGINSLSAEAHRLGGRLWVREALELGGVALSVALPTRAHRRAR